MPPMAILAAYATISLISHGMQAVSQFGAAGQEKQAIDLQAAQNESKYQQESLSNYDIMQNMLDKQTAEASTRGVALNSPSLNALQRNTYNIGAQKAANIETQEDISAQNAEIEKKNVKSALIGKLFGDAASAAKDMFGVYTQMPTAKG